MITIGLPVYNAENFIKYTLNSIINQTYKEWNCIIVDDGSVDLSFQIIESVVKNDVRFRLIRDGQNLGLATRLNQIADMTQTPYLARMDADDIMYPERLEQQFKYMQDHPNIDLIGAAAYVIDDNNKIFGIRVGLNSFTVVDCIRESPFIHPTIMGRTEWFAENKYATRAERYEDYELWLRTVENSRFYNLDKPLLFYREGGSGHAGKYIATVNGIISTLDAMRERNLNEQLNQELTRKIQEVKFKKLAYKIAGVFNLESYLVKSRSRSISEEDLESAAVSLNMAVKSH